MTGDREGGEMSGAFLAVYVATEPDKLVLFCFFPNFLG